MEKKWFFSEDNTIGNDYSDHGTETFKNNNDGAEKFKKFAREMVQNAIDVKNEKISEPLIVEFQLFEVDKNKLPELDGLEEHIQGTVDYCEKNNKLNNAYNSSKRELKILNKDKIRILKISDYNTIGICDSTNLSSPDSGWNGLIYNDGDSVNKGADSLGSHGLGKGAAFAMSNLRTVFYNTKDKTGTRALEGVSRQYVSYVKGKKKYYKGYYGKYENNTILPFINEEIDEFSDIFNRNATGSDVFVLEPDVSYLSEEHIKWYLIESVICNFFVAIRDGLLEIKINGTEVNQNRLEQVFSLLNSFYEKNNIEKSDSLIATEQYLKSLDANNIISEDLDGYGIINLWLYKDSYTKWKNVAIVRKNGMLIKSIDVKYANQKFAGVVIVQGPEGVEFLRSIEDPSHMDFDPSRTTPEKYGTTEDKQKRLNNFYEWIKNQAKAFTKIVSDDKFTLSGMEDYIQMPSEEVKKYNPQNMAPTVIKTKATKASKPRVAKKTSVDNSDDGVSLISPDGDKTKGSKIPNPNPKETNNPKEDDTSKRKGFVKTYEASYELGPVIKHNKNESVLVFEITESDKDFKLKVSAVDEDGNENGLLPIITYAYDVNNGIELKVKRHIVYGLKCQGIMKLILKFDEPIVSCIKPIIYWEEEVE